MRPIHAANSSDRVVPVASRRSPLALGFLLAMALLWRSLPALAQPKDAEEYMLTASNVVASTQHTNTTWPSNTSAASKPRITPLRALAEPQPEYDLKAILVVAFAQATTWPSNAPTTSNSPIVIGVLGDDPFGDVLDRMARDREGKRRLLVRRVASAAEAAQCQVVFIGQKESRNESAWLDELKDKSVLTIGESGQTLKRGGILELFVAVDKRVRYEASWPAMERARLKLSADLLACARKVHQPPHKRP